MSKYRWPSSRLSASWAAPPLTSTTLRKVISDRSSIGPPGMGWLATGAAVPGAAVVGTAVAGAGAAVGEVQLATARAAAPAPTAPGPQETRGCRFDGMESPL